jgi:hypothetical protein
LNEKILKFLVQHLNYKMIASDPNVYVWLIVLTAFCLTGGMLITLTVEAINSSTDCVLEKPSVLSTLNEEVEDEADEAEDDEADEAEADEAEADEAEAEAEAEAEDEDDEDEDEDEDTPAVDTDEEDRIVGKKVNRLLARTLDTLLEIRKAREERQAKRLKVE